MVAKYETVQCNLISRQPNVAGSNVASYLPFFKSRGLIEDVKDSLRLQKEGHRIYDDYLRVTLNYTPNTRAIWNNQENYCFVWRTKTWRIIDAVESNDRMKMSFYCYQSDPGIDG